MKTASLKTTTLSVCLLTALTLAACSKGGTATETAAQNNQIQNKPSAEPKTDAKELPLMLKNGLPNEMHRRLDALVGEWDVEKSLFVAGGTTEKPIVSSGMICRREWISETGNRHLRDTTQGTLAENPYYRLGILSYSTMDKRYEWNTVDATNSMMMTYKGAKNSAAAGGDIVMSGEFTDQGIFGDSSAGKTIGQRTVIKIESPDRHIIELHFTPPGEPERLIDRSVYARRK